MVEGPALEKRYPVKNGIVGSNPTLSARALSMKALPITFNETVEKLFFSLQLTIFEGSKFAPLNCKNSG